MPSADTKQGFISFLAITIGNAAVRTAGTASDGRRPGLTVCTAATSIFCPPRAAPVRWRFRSRSEEHTSELQSRENLVCRLLLEKKNIIPIKGDVYRYNKKDS